MLWAAESLCGFCPLELAKSSEWDESVCPFVGTVTDFRGCGRTA